MAPSSTPESKIFLVVTFISPSASSLLGYHTHIKNVASWCSLSVDQARNQLLRSPHTHKPSRCFVVHTVQQKLYGVIHFSHVDRMCTRNRCKHISIMESHIFETWLPWINKNLPIRSIVIYTKPTNQSIDILPAHHLTILMEVWNTLQFTLPTPL